MIHLFISSLVAPRLLTSRLPRELYSRERRPLLHCKVCVFVSGFISYGTINNDVIRKQNGRK